MSVCAHPHIPADRLVRQQTEENGKIGEGRRFVTSRGHTHTLTERVAEGTAGERQRLMRSPANNIWWIFKDCV